MLAGPSLSSLLLTAYFEGRSGLGQFAKQI